MAGGSKAENMMEAAFKIVQRDLGENWIDLALWLELDYVDILEIKRETSLRWQSRMVLEKWRQQHGKEATIEKLLEALREVGRQDLAEKVIQELYPETASSSHSQVKLEGDCTSRNQGTFIGTSLQGNPMQNKENTTKPKTKRKNSKPKRFATRQNSTSKSNCKKSTGQNLSNIKVKHLEFAVNAVEGLQFAKQMHLRCCYLMIEAFTTQLKNIQSAADRLEQEARDQISQFYNANKDLCKAAIMKVFKGHKVLRNDLEIAKMWPSSIYVQTILKSEECVTALNEYQESGQLATDLQHEFENIGFCCPLQVAVLSTEQLEGEVAGIVEKAMDMLSETDDKQRDVSNTDYLTTSPSNQIAKDEDHVDSYILYIEESDSLEHDVLQRNACEEYDDEVFKVIEEVSRELTGKTSQEETSMERRTLDQDIRTAKQAWDDQDDSEEINKALKMARDMTADLNIQLEPYGQFVGEDVFEFKELLTDTSDSELEEESAKVIEEVLGKGKLSQRILGERDEYETDKDEETSRRSEELKDIWKDALLRITAWTGDEDKVKTLLQAGVQVNTVNSDGETPLWDAVKGGHTNIVSLLLQAGANTDTADKNGSTPLLLATSLGYRAVCKALIHGNADVNTADRQQRTPLEMAIRNTDWPILTTLIRAGADVNKTPGTFGDASPLSLSVKELMCFEKGIGSDRSPSFEEDHSGEWFAEWYERVSIFEALVRAGAKINSTDKHDQTLLLSVCKEGCKKTVKLLLDNGADADKPDNRGRTPLYIAAQKGHVKIVSILTQENADLNKADDEQKTPLWIAARKGHVKIVQTLIEAGADISLQDNTGMTPLHAALQMKQHAVVSMLAKHAELERDRKTSTKEKSPGFHTTKDFEYG
ncbi:uncharacterized protein LOC144862829 [Branchiostoma floridae x Branchiostoma japonicum]